MDDGETAKDMYRRLTAICLDYGGSWVSQGNDKWVKRKFYNALFPYEETRLNSIRSKSNFHVMSSNEVPS
jgi:hypothetical protein